MTYLYHPEASILVQFCTSTLCFQLDFFGSKKHQKPSKNTMGNSSSILDSVWASWGPFGDHFGPSWGHLGASWGHVRALLAPSWAHLGPILAHSGPSWAHLELILRHLEPPGGHHGPILVHLGPSWPHFEPIFGLFWPLLGPS